MDAVVEVACAGEADVTFDAAGADAAGAAGERMPVPGPVGAPAERT
jgi:hypothetical protein